MQKRYDSALAPYLQSGSNRENQILYYYHSRAVVFRPLAGLGGGGGQCITTKVFGLS